MIALCCGSRFWKDREIVAWYLGRLLDPEALVIHGGNGYDADGNMLRESDDDLEAVRGADMLCGDVARRFGHPVERYFADWRGEGRAAGPARNRLMGARLKQTERSQRVAIAFHDDPWMSAGTGNMLRIIRDGNIAAIRTIDSKGRID